VNAERPVRQGPRSFWLCADDYGISPAVNAAIRALIAGGRINATSVMTAAPHLSAQEAGALSQLNAGEKRAALGLHVTLTAPFKPLSAGFAPLREGCFLPQSATMRASLARRLKPETLAVEIAAQLRAFADAFGRMPDFLDGHQHVHLLPQVRDAFLKVVAQTAPTAWVRQCGRARSARDWRERKALVLDVMSLGFKRKARRLGILTNPAFDGAYDFTRRQDFAKLFPRFLTGLPAGGLIMCHPGHVDATLERLDSLTDQREREFAYFNSDDFLPMLAAHGFALARPEAG
jgi:predicted glycoside hydrolase/deacetylase ChbG (UPF0249 family)